MLAMVVVVAAYRVALGRQIIPFSRIKRKRCVLHAIILVNAQIVMVKVLVM